MNDAALRLLVFGAAGQVGSALRAGVWPGVDVVPFTRADVDLTDRRAIERALAGRGPFDGRCVVVNAAAYTAVDRAEQEPEAAFAANRDGPAALAAASAAVGAPLVHLSTDYVFDGAKAEAYDEDDPIAPLGVYGRSKAEGEEAVRAAAPRHLIIRTSWVFGCEGANFVKTMLRLGAERSELRVVADQVGGPTAAADIAAMIARVAAMAAARDDGWGTYHFSGAPAVSWHQLACAVFAERRRRFGAPEPAVLPIAAADWPTPARRPANSTLNCRRIAERFGVAQPDWRAALVPVVAAWGGPQTGGA